MVFKGNKTSGPGGKARGNKPSEPANKAKGNKPCDSANKARGNKPSEPANKAKGNKPTEPANKAKGNKAAAPKLPVNWYYMSGEEITVSEIRDVLDPVAYDIQIWKEAGVLEIGVAEKAAVDVEACELDLGDEYSNQYLEDHGVKSLFYITIDSREEAACRGVMEHIVKALGGRFCADTDDFTPVIS